VREDSAAFALANTAASKSPRFVVGILFSPGSLYLTSHAGIAGVPGTVFNGVLKGNSALSQRLVPEQGRAEIGALDFEAVDISGALTTEFRSKLTNLQGLRDVTVKLWHGFEGDAFSALQLFQTQQITGVDVDGSLYSFKCEDITRQQRKEIFAPKTTNLRLSCTASDTTIFVGDTSEFDVVYHGAAYTDAPSSFVGYFKLEDEIIRYTGKTPDAFTGCTRGTLNTRAKPHTVDTNATLDRRRKIDEVIFLEGPAIEIAYAINTGVIFGTAYTLPDHWHLGIDTALLRTADWTGIGPDLWDAADRTKGVQLTFLRPKKQDGKTFVERELLMLCGLYSPVYSDGTLGLRRSAAVIQDSAPVATLTTANVTQVGSLSYDMKAMRNRFRIEWSWDGDNYRRSSEWIDGNSIAVHKESDWFEAKFTGLIGRRHTDVTIRQRLSQLADRMSAPPWRLSLTVLGSLNRIEVGDVVRVAIDNVKDFAGENVSIDRAFEVQQVSVDYITGDVQLDLFGSTAKPTETPLEFSGVPALPDAYYDQAGTALSSVMTIDGSGVVSGGPYTLTGTGNNTDAGSIWYYPGDLTNGTGVTINLVNNARLRVRGFLQNNGTINGTGGGHPGVADSGTATVFPDGTPGFVGNSRGRDGQNISQESGNPVMRTIAAKVTRAQYPVFPYHAISVDSLTLNGTPTDLRGTGGAPGGKVTYQVGTQRAAGGTGGAGGAGLLIECRGLACGVAGSIVLNGADGLPGTRWDTEGKGWNPGAGGAGGPGSMMVILDGSTVSLPDLTGKFFAVCGAVPTPAPFDGKLKYLEQPGDQRYSLNERNYAGFDDPAVISAADLSDACLRIQYAPYPISANDDRDDPPAAPTNFSAISGPGYIRLLFDPADEVDTVTEIWASPDSTLGNATLVRETRETQFYHALLDTVQRFYFFRSKKRLDENTFVFSPFVPGTTSSITSTSLGFATADIPEQDNFLERFEETNILDRYDSVFGSGSITVPVGSGTLGGKVLQVAGGSRALVYAQNIPIDPLGLYRMTARIRQTVAPTNSNNDGVYLGFRGIAADAVTPVFAGGADHYPVAANLDLGLALLGEWITVTGYFIGASGTTVFPAPDINNPSRLTAGVVYIRPIIFANYLNGDGTQQFDYLRIEKMVAGRWQDIAGLGKPSDFADNTTAQAPTVSGVFFDGFEHQNWPLFYNNRNTSVSTVITYPQEGQNGGRVLQAAGGPVWIAWKENIAFDSSAYYRVTARIRRTSIGSGSNGVYMGVEAVLGNGTTLVNIAGLNDAGNQHYVAANNFNLGSIAVGTWTDVIGYFRGNGTPSVPANSINTPSPLFTGAAYFRPLIVMNWGDGTHTVQCDFIRVERLTSLGTALIDPNAVNGVSSATVTGPVTATQVAGAGLTNHTYASISFTPDVDCLAILRCTADVACTDPDVVGDFALCRGRIERTTSPFTIFDSQTQTITKQTVDNMRDRVATEFVASLLAGVPYTAVLRISTLDFGVITYDISVSGVLTLLQLVKR
jgi:hypothetical protein